MVVVVVVVVLVVLGGGVVVDAAVKMNTASNHIKSNLRATKKKQKKTE